MDVRLVMFKENGERKDFPLGEGVTLIGRQDDCDLRIPLSEISRKHAQLIIHGGAVTLRDMGSANGTYVNNRKISERDLTPGDHIVIGPVVFTVQINGEPENVRQVKTRLESRKHEPTAKAPPADSSAATEVGQIDEDELFSEASENVDPISALEALAASGEQNFVDELLEDNEDDHDHENENENENESKDEPHKKKS
jgi:pSer/pThr/pTyr-binding forkhead associated (FHA) protein